MGVLTLRLRAAVLLLLRVRKVDELLRVALHLLLGDHQLEVVEQQELQLELVELGLWEAADLRARVSET